ncbi:MAG: PIG-L family deacetylase [Clostridia bacterium]|nr:PIG-L family deacetylase [Clostridia bacterium]
MHILFSIIVSLITCFFILAFIHFKKLSLFLLTLVFVLAGSFTFCYFYSIIILLQVDIVIFCIFLVLNLIHFIFGKYVLRYSDNENALKVQNKNILIFVPHEDDEINLMGGLIEFLIKEQTNNVYVYFFTNGDAFVKGTTRQKEALKCAKKYGLKEENVIFGGYGDLWQGANIYFSEGDEEKVSFCGKTEKYAIEKHRFFGTPKYTRNNVIKDFTDVILQTKADIVFANDCDIHGVHKSLSMFLDEAMKIVVKKYNLTPILLKGFCYDGVYNGKDDFHNKVLQPTILEGKYSNDNFYSRNNALIYPVYSKGLSKSIEFCSTFKKLMIHRSQHNFPFTRNVINSDKLFWQRRTDNLLLKEGVISVSSGNKEYLTDYKIFDYTDFKINLKPDKNFALTFSEDDGKKEIKISFENYKHIALLNLYECSFDVDASAKIRIKYNDNTLNDTLYFGKINNYVINADVKELTISFSESNERVHLSEIEAFSNITQEVPIRFLAISHNANYIYDYVADDKTCNLTVVDDKGVCREDVEIISTNGDYSFSDGKIIVNNVDKDIKMKIKHNGLEADFKIEKPRLLKKIATGYVFFMEKRFLTVNGVNHMFFYYRRTLKKTLKNLLHGSKK